MKHISQARVSSCAAALAVAVTLGGAGCGLLSPRPDHSRYAVLASVDDLQSVAPVAHATAGALSVGLGPIRVPDYLLSAAIVTRDGGTRVVHSATERWAEPFERSLGRVLAINLRREAGVGSVCSYPWYATEEPQVQVEIEFSRCERDLGDGVIVAARWQVIWLDGSRESEERETRVQRPARHADQDADGPLIALAMSDALAELCGRIGETLRSASKGGQPAQ